MLTGLRETLNKSSLSALLVKSGWS